MKKIKRRSVLCLVLVLIQVFFVFSLTAIAADDTSEGVVLSLSMTTLEQDLTEAAVAEKDAMYIEGQRALSMVAFAAEQDGQKFDLYLYLFSPTGFDDVQTIRITITEKLDGKEKVSPIYGTILDRSKTLVKVVLDDTSSYNCGYDAASNTLQMSVDNVKIRRSGRGEETHGVSYNAFSTGDAVNGSYSFTYNLSDGLLQSSLKSDVLELQVTLVSERVSSADVNTYKQINTAMMLIPETFFERYGDLESIEYMYSLYDQVPMLVSTSVVIDSISKANDVAFRQNAGSFVSTAPLYFFWFDGYSFKSNSEDAYYDVESETILSALNDARLIYPISGSLVSFDKYIGASSYLSDTVYLKDFSDVIVTESYDKATTWWQKCLDGRGFVENIDDSLNLNAIQVLDSVDLSLSDAKLSELYCIDKYYLTDFRKMAEQIASGYKMVLFRYLITDYEVHDFDIVTCDDESFMDAQQRPLGYICRQAIIENFQILKLCFCEEDSLGNIERTIVYPDNPEKDYVGGTESGGKLENEKTEPIFTFLKGGDGNGCQDAWSTVVHVLVALAIAFALFWLLRFIALVRDAFGRRYPREDKPSRERRRRK